MTAYEGVMLVIGILGLLIPMIGIIVKLIIAYIDAVKTTGLAGGLFCPYKGLLPACARKAH